MTDFSHKLKDAGLKITLPRIKILKILEAHADQHFSVEDIYKLLLEEDEDVGIATIYRVLTQCEQAGLVKRLQFEDSPALFELNQDDHHDHFVCTGCGRVEEFHDSIIEQRQQEIATKAGFELEDHSMVLYGLCPKCQKKTGIH